MPLSTALSGRGLAGFKHLLNKEVGHRHTDTDTRVQRATKAYLFLLPKNSVWSSLSHLVSQIKTDS